VKAAIEKVDELLTEKRKESSSEYRPPSLDSALKYLEDSNLVLISVPGKYAAEEAKKALDRNLHVMLFSDNVTVAEEKELKELAASKGLLMMGPDCGTAIINNTPLAFANVVRKGPIGVVGASGTGTQEVTVLIDRLGEGVSQVIGTGGRDLREEIGGIMMIQGIEALANDPDTKVIVLVSKPPAPAVADKVLKVASRANKPVVVNFIGGDPQLITKYGGYPCTTLEDAAHKAVALAQGKIVVEFNGFTLEEKDIEGIIQKELSKFAKEQKYLRGLFTGGTLADEAMKLLGKEIGCIYSNIPLSPEYTLRDVNISIENTCIDLGDDEFTVGRPHPMIDPITRVERLNKESDDAEMAVLIMDFVLGYGSHKDPIGEMLPAIREAKEKVSKRGGHLSVIASVCGTHNDPQGYDISKERLEEAGVVVMPSNAQATKLASRILTRLRQE